ncbi:MAG: hypothetical protein IT444_13480 [Phycisphaeraceae bacterium]|nr:hypothetical protein [Phycisphaeraceae bacterium]
MKAVGIVAVLVVVVLGVIYWSGGFTGKSPEEIAREFKVVAVAGTSWEKVADHMEPKEFQALSSVTMSTNSMTPGVSQPYRFNRAEFAQKYKSGAYKEGFIFNYYFSNNDAWAVEFDGSGCVVEGRPLPVLKDLFTLPSSH